jgi:DNA replication protein DnaC
LFGLVTTTAPHSSPASYPVEHWHKIIGDPTLAGAILDRLTHNAYQITMVTIQCDF